MLTSSGWAGGPACSYTPMNNKGWKKEMKEADVAFQHGMPVSTSPKLAHIGCFAAVGGCRKEI